VWNSEPTFFFRKDHSRSIHGVALSFAADHCSGGLYAVAQYQLMNFTHEHVCRVFSSECKWDSTDANYSKVY